MKKLLGSLLVILVTVFLTISPAMADDSSSVFANCYHIEDPDMQGAPVFALNLLFNPSNNTVRGKGRIAQLDLLNMKTELEGEYISFVSSLSPNLTFIKAIGYPDIDFPPDAGIGPVILPNVKLEMQLKNLESGIASYKYDSRGEQKFISMDLIPVQSVSCSES